MTLSDIKIVSYCNTSTKRFSYWVKIIDYKNHHLSNKQSRKSLIEFFELAIGPLGQKWQYSSYGNGIYQIKFNDEKDLLFFLLRAKKD